MLQSGYFVAFVGVITMYLIKRIYSDQFLHFFTLSGPRFHHMLEWGRSVHMSIHFTSEDEACAMAEFLVNVIDENLDLICVYVPE